jgi:predicted lipid-binding transport protein (Tim44 family)
MNGSGLQLIDIILLAVVAGFLILRLRSVLGRRTGHEERTDPMAAFRNAERRGERREDEDTVVRFPEREGANADTAGIRRADLPGDVTPLDKGLAAIRQADSAFNPQEFVSGGRMAFEMILMAYAKGELKSLRPLLANEVFEEFAGAIREREQAGEQLETTLVGIKQAEIAEAELQGKTAFVTVKFVSEQINVTRDKAGQVIDGGDKRVETITDLWTFARNTRSRDPNWTLVATDTPE